MAAKPEYISPEEYLRLERQAEYKSEYVDGVMYAMSGASEKHNLIAINMATELNLQLRSTRCKVYPSDMKVRVPSSRKFFYPDVSVVCDEARFADDEKDALLNPLVIIEVLSESTTAYDRGKKFQFYQEIESFKEYVLIEQDEPVVERYVRQPDGSWVYTKVAGLEQSFAFSSIKCEAALKDIYAKTGL
jgi:Uma2 family endonuclease